VGQAFATKAIAECIRRSGLSEAESNIDLLDLVSTPAAADWDASFTVKCINLWENVAKGSQRKCEFDHIREVPFIPEADDLALATSHLAHSSSASCVTAAQAGFYDGVSRLPSLMAFDDPRTLKTWRFTFGLLSPGRTGWVGPDGKEHAPEALAEFLLRHFMDLQQRQLVARFNQFETI
jgi:hypothetical protein